MSVQLEKGVKRIATLAVLTAGVAFAEVRLVEPPEGAVMPLLTDAQKAYVQMPRAERRVKFADKAFRKSEMGLPAEKVGGVERKAFWPKTVRLVWTAPEGAPCKVTVRDKKTDAVVWEETVKRGETHVDNLEIAAGYVWTVETGGEKASATFKTEGLAPRLVRFPDVPNVRDLGGRIGLGGKRVRQGMIFRSAGLNENAHPVYFTKEELAASGELAKIEKAAADARPRYEQLLAWQKDPGTMDREDADYKGWCTRHPHEPLAKFLKSRIDRTKRPVELAKTLKVEKERVPGWVRVQGEKGEYIRHRFGIRSDIDLRRDGECFGMKGSPLGDSVTWFHYSSASYAAMQDKFGREAFAKVFRVFLDRRNYPVDFHCIAGQDRTGAVAFILNALLGVDENQLALDWELTGFCNRSAGFCHERLYDKLVEGFTKNYPAPNLRESVEKYVLSLGFGEADLAAFRNIMLE